MSIVLTTGEPGSGKTFSRGVLFLVSDFLTNPTNRVFFTNLPLNVERIADYICSRKLGFFSRHFSRKFTRDEIISRIVIIPDTELAKWRLGLTGPWDYFADVDLRNCYISVDEIHEIINNSTSGNCVQKWDNFLGTIRHRGCIFEGITQSVSRVNKVFSSRCGIRYEVQKVDKDRDPYFNVPLLDWLRLFRSYYHNHFNLSVVNEFRLSPHGRWKLIGKTSFLLRDSLFPLYDSFNASLANQEAKVGQGAEIEDKGFFKCLAWFFYHHWWSLTSRILLAVFVFWFVFFGFRLVVSRVINSIFGTSAKQEIVENVSADELCSINSESVKQPCLISEDFMYYTDGSFIQIGDDYNDKKIKKFDIHNFSIIFDDDTCEFLH